MQHHAVVLSARFRSRMEIVMICLKSLGKTASLLVVVSALGGVTAARADTIYAFNGDCADCKNAKAVLIVKDYTNGDLVTTDNFVSFTYTSSIFPHGFSVVEAEIFAIGSAGLPLSTGYADLAIEWRVSTNVHDYFRTTQGGDWSLTRLQVQDPDPGPGPGHGGGSGGGQSMDFGYDYALTLGSPTTTVSSVPLPASAPMFGAAVLALGLVGYGVKGKKAAAA